MSNLDITLELSESKGRAVLKKDEQEAGEMTFYLKEKNIIVIEHTEVDPELQDRGLGRKLLDKVVALAREKKWTIIPQCPFAKHIIETDPSLKDLLHHSS